MLRSAVRFCSLAPGVGLRSLGSAPLAGLRSARRAPLTSHKKRFSCAVGASVDVYNGLSAIDADGNEGAAAVVVCFNDDVAVEEDFEDVFRAAMLVFLQEREKKDISIGNSEYTPT